VIPNSLCQISLTVGMVVRKCFAIARALANGYVWRNASNCGPQVKVKVKGGRSRGGRSHQGKAPLLNLWSQILIWDHPSVSSPNVLTNSWWIVFTPHPLIQKSLITNLWSSFSIYRRQQISRTSQIEDRLTYSMNKFVEICYPSSSWRIIVYVIANRNPCDNRPVRR
jgi:hypothetical protein